MVGRKVDVVGDAGLDLGNQPLAAGERAHRARVDLGQVVRRAGVLLPVPGGLARVEAVGGAGVGLEAGARVEERVDQHDCAEAPGVAQRRDQCGEPPAEVDALVEVIRGIVNAQNPHEKVDEIVAIAKKLFPLTSSAKHMNGRDGGRPIKTGTYLAFYNVLKIPMAFSSKGQTNRFRKAVSQWVVYEYCCPWI